MTTETLELPALEAFKAVKHRFNIGEYVVWNTAMYAYDHSGGEYSNVDLGMPRTISGGRIANFYRPSRAAGDMVKLSNGNAYFKHHLTYGQFAHCCGKFVSQTIPMNKRRFYRGLWLLLAGLDSPVYAGVDGADSLSHTHGVQFSSDWSSVRIYISPLRGGSHPTTMKSLRGLASIYEKKRAVYSIPASDESIVEFKKAESALLSTRVAAMRTLALDAESSFNSETLRRDDQMSYISEQTCHATVLTDAIALMAEKGKWFDPLLDSLSNLHSDTSRSKRELSAMHRRVENAAINMSRTKAAIANTSGERSCHQALMALVDSKVVGGISWEGVKLRILFNSFDMKIGPAIKCELKAKKCKCQIVIPGTISIPSFILCITTESSSNLKFNIELHRKDVYHPHFRTDGHHCLGGYEDAVLATLKVFDIASFLMVMADYIHSFNVHSMLTDYNMFDFKIDGGKLYEFQDGIFSEDSEEYGRDSGDDECGNCGGDGCDECGDERDDEGEVRF